MEQSLGSKAVVHSREACLQPSCAGAHLRSTGPDPAGPGPGSLHLSGAAAADRTVSSKVLDLTASEEIPILRDAFLEGMSGHPKAT